MASTKSNLSSSLLVKSVPETVLPRVTLDNQSLSLQEKSELQDFPGGPVAKTPHAQCRGPRFDSWSGPRSHILQLRPSTAKQIKYFFLKNQSCNYNFHSNNVKSKQSLAKKKKTDKRKYIIISTTAVFYKTGNLVSRKESLSSPSADTLQLPPMFSQSSCFPKRLPIYIYKFYPP